MKKITLALSMVVLSVFSSQVVHATYLLLPGNSAQFLNGASNCTASNGSLQAFNSNSICSFSFHVPLDAGKTLKSVTFYYFDNSGSQNISAIISKRTLSTGTTTTIASFLDQTTSASVQFTTMSANNEVLSSSSAYFTDGLVWSGTRLEGIKIDYQ